MLGSKNFNIEIYVRNNLPHKNGMLRNYQNVRNFANKSKVL